jgi:hypothetical protein
MTFFVRKTRPKVTVIMGLVIFILMMFVNLKISAGSAKSGAINLDGIKLELVSPSAYAEGYSCSVGTVCSDGHTISCNGTNYCQRSPWSVTCDGQTTFCNSY